MKNLTLINSSNKFQIFYSESTDPFINLSIEDFLLRNLKDHQKILLLYTNDKSVVLGRFQNPWVECLLDKMNDDQVNLVRRQSGGGTVYHDLGNLNFSFIESQLTIDKESHHEIIIHALKDLGIKAFSSDRSDLMCKDGDVLYKFSGSAFKQTRNRSLHHGTLLIDSKLEDLKLYLHAKKREILTKATQSVRKSVINLSEINSELTKSSMIKALVNSYNIYHKESCEVIHIDDAQFINEEEYIKYLKHLKTQKWVLGETPKFNQKFIFSSINYLVTFDLLVQKGIIKEASFCHEIFHDEINTRISSLFINMSFTKDTVQKAKSILLSEFSMFSDELTQSFDEILVQIY